MLDLAGILSTAILMIIIIVRAVQLDARDPWFQTVKRKAPAEKKAIAAWRPTAARPAWRRRT
jgi:hypothetical protein